MPTGNGTWPAYWTYGTNWPDDGEIDILEGIYTFDHNQITLHTRNHCEMQVNDSIYFSGTWVDQNNLPGTNCYINAPGIFYFFISI
jgi:beta-glucanase (GH16 family)